MTEQNKNTVLIVEDNKKILDINRRLLEKEGCVVATAQTLAEARERLDGITPDAVVLDIMLPDGSGLDFLPELRALCAAPVLFLTAKAERDDILAGLTAGGNDYITKPYDIDEFRLRVMGQVRFMNSVRSRASQEKIPASLLSERESAIARLAADGLSNKEIGMEVFLSESRVKTCLSGIYRKLEIGGDEKNKRERLRSL